MFKLIKKLSLSFPFILLIIEFFHPIYALEEDLGRHLLFGELIALVHKIPNTNLISYTFTDYPYVLNHWLSEAVYFFIVKFINFDGLLLFTIGLFIFSFGLLYVFVIRKVNPFLLASIAVVYVAILFERSTIRPEMFGFLFLSIYMVILYTYREKFTYLIFLLIPLEILWVNFQINFPFGPLVGACFLIEELIRKRDQILQERKIPKHSLILFIVLLLSTLAALINPNFLEGFLYPLVGFKDIGHSVKELQGVFTVQTFYTRISHIMFVIASAILGFSLFFSKKTKIADILIAIIFILLGITAVRNIPFFIFSTFIACCVHADNVFTRFTKARQHLVNKFAGFKIDIIFVSVLFFITIVISYYAISTNGFGFGINQEMKYAADFIINNNIKGPIFNDNDHGQYLAYRLYPKEKIFIDIRETYPPSFYKDVYYPMHNDPKVFEKMTDKYNINTVIYSHLGQTPWTRKFIRSIVNNPDWIMVYLDDSSMILVRNIPQNKNLINKFGMSRKKVVLSHHDLNSEKSLNRLAHFFIYAGWGEHIITIFKKVLDVSPNSCTAFYYLANLLNKENQEQADYYSLRYRQACN